MGKSVSRRDFIGASGAAALTGVAASSSLAALGAAQTAAGQSSITASLAKKPNLIFFMPDEMRADSLACYGNPVTKTPNIDRLAQQGARFANCYDQYPVCGASRCSLLTGWPRAYAATAAFITFFVPKSRICSVICGARVM